LEAIEAPECLQKRLLNGITRLVLGSQDPTGSGEHGLRVHSHQLGESGIVTAAQSFEQALVPRIMGR